MIMNETTQPIPLTDLRVGNAVTRNLDNEIVIVTQINSDAGEIRCHRLNDPFYKTVCFSGGFSGIPLTEEQLEKLGFSLRERYSLYMRPKDDSVGLKIYYNGSIVICVEYEDGYGYSNYTDTGKHITTVHELQNAFYWITGTELTLKQ